MGLFAYPKKFDDRQTVSKLDHHFSEKDILTVRYGYEKNANPLSTNNFPGYQTSEFNRYHAAMVAETHVFSPSLTNELRLPYNRFVFDVPLGCYRSRRANASAVCLHTSDGHWRRYRYPQGRIANSFVLQDTVSYVRGRHTFRTGIDLLESAVAANRAAQVVRGS